MLAFYLSLSLLPFLFIYFFSELAPQCITCMTWYFMPQHVGKSCGSENRHEHMILKSLDMPCLVTLACHYTLKTICNISLGISQFFVYVQLEQLNIYRVFGCPSIAIPRRQASALDVAGKNLLVWIVGQGHDLQSNCRILNSRDCGMSSFLPFPLFLDSLILPPLFSPPS